MDKSKWKTKSDLTPICLNFAENDNLKMNKIVVFDKQGQNALKLV